ncbi:MAG: NADH-quinone oxidoreductase subunit N [Candidatus Eisenbacteria bacterium]|nr:NADH-quinone oxidoreductase subunit N [Candidatus Eisenbacteria bacterium]
MQVLEPIQIQLLLPELILALGGIFVLLCVFARRESPDLTLYLTLFTIALSGISLSLASDFRLVSGDRLPLLFMDSFSTYSRAVFLLSSFLVAIFSRPYVERERIPSPEYFSLILFSTCGMNLLASARDLLVVFMGLELLSISLWALTAIHKRDPRSNEASLKFFLLSAFASGFFLYGMAFAFGATGTFSLAGVREETFLGGFGQTASFVSFGLILVGLGFKVGLVPFHMWIPDVYEGAPTPVTAFLSAGPKVAGFAALARILAWMFPELPYTWESVLAILALVTMTFGNLLAIAQEDIKRMLAYSSIAHAGYMLVGVISLEGAGNAPLLFYFLVYSIMSIGAFSIVLLLEKRDIPANALTGFSGLSKTNPLVAFSMAVFMIALSGIPPTAGFAGKFYVFGAAVKSGYVWLAVAGVLNSVISVFYYLRVVVLMYMREPAEGAAPFKVDSSIGMVVFISLLGVLLLGLFPHLGSEAFLFRASEIVSFLR